MAELLYIEWRYEDMIKVIASDMDGTLLCDDHRIAPDTIAAVKEACAAGIRFMVATGRGYEGAMAELDGTGIVCDYILGKYYSGDAAFSCKYDPGRGRENKRISQGDRKCKGCF